MTSEDTHNATSLQGELFGNSHSDKPDGQTTGQCGQDHALVSLLVQPENSKEPMIQGIYGRTYIDSSVKLDQMSALENRLVVRLATLGSTESAMILRQKATPAGRRILRLVPSTRLTNGRDCVGMRWQTVTTQDSSGRGYQTRHGKIYPTLPGQLDPRKLSRWITASARDWKDTPGMATKSGDRNRIDQCPRQMAAQATGETTGSNATTEKRGAPNPAFSFWLMGFSYRWMLSVARALQTYKKPSRKTALKRGE